ncbi:nucleotidyltransferase domain protein, partial [Gregarina niphandrodes]
MADCDRAELYVSFAALGCAEQLHEEILAFIAWADLTRGEVEDRKKILANISVVSQTLWPDCQLAPFGSFFNGLSLPLADVDICILNVPTHQNNLRNDIHDLARLLKSCPFTTEVNAVTKARVPIVKFTDKSSDVQVDLTINQDSAMKTSGYIHERVTTCPHHSYPLDSYPIHSYPLDSYPLDSYPLDSYPLDSYPLD